MAFEFIIEIHADPNNPICDFCSAKPVVGEFRKKADVEIGTTVIGNMEWHHIDKDGRWAVCATCKNFIETNDMERLAAHSAKILSKMYDIPYQAALDAVRAAHMSFWSDR